MNDRARALSSSALNEKFQTFLEIRDLDQISQRGDRARVTPAQHQCRG
jgi:hypothetical protein